MARQSIRNRTTIPIPAFGLILPHLQYRDLYFRPIERRDGRLWDPISEAPMATEFAISRFLTPILAGRGWSVFMDSDVLVRSDISKLFDFADPKYAVQVVKHNYQPPASEKMDGQLQLLYARKNWSSVMLFNVEHPANRRLTTELINTVPGRDLHRFCWLEDHEIGELPVSWNYLVGHNTPDECPEPDLVHFTSGIPSMPGYADAEYSGEWQCVLRNWAMR